MLLNKRIGILVLLLATKPVAAGVLAAQCAQVHCDCDALAEQKWRNECVAQEQRIVAECSRSAGKLQSYCGVHGPLAFPVATSIQAGELSLRSKEEFKALSKQIDTQQWSLSETHATFKSAITQGEYGQAIQLAGLLDKESQKLFELQKQATAALMADGKKRDAQSVAAGYAAANIINAANLMNLSSQYWQRIAVTDAPKEQRAYKILSFKAARTAATVYEFSADLYADAQDPKQAAHLWQQSASIAQKLIGWESLTENNPKHLSFYQAQASARWHRATFYWLQANDLEQVARSSSHARSYLGQGGVGNMVSAQGDDDLHRVDKEDMRAMKRGK